MFEVSYQAQKSLEVTGLRTSKAICSLIEQNARQCFVVKHAMAVSSGLHVQHQAWGLLWHADEPRIECQKVVRWVRTKLSGERDSKQIRLFSSHDVFIDDAETCLADHTAKI
jgi:hypothetical protein